jgi:hypothetical protein
MELGFMLVLIDSILDTLDGIRVHFHSNTYHCLVVHVKFISSKKKTPSKQKQNNPLKNK